MKGRKKEGITSMAEKRVFPVRKLGFGKRGEKERVVIKGKERERERR